jgi:CRP-like cAMP-binding protein
MPSEHTPFLPALVVDRRALLRAHPFFKDLDRRLVEKIEEHAVVRKAKAGVPLFRKGDEGSSFYAVLSGTVRITTGSTGGKDAIFGLVLPGEIFGEIAVLDGGVRSADAVTMGPCELIVINRRDFIPLLHEFPALGVRLIELLCGRLRHSSELVEDIVFLDLPRRLAKVILYLHNRTPRTKGQTVLRVTQRELSQMIGASRESTNKQLRRWERAKILKMGRGTVILHTPPALGQLIEDVL